MDSCPYELRAYETAYRMEANRNDVLNWQLGQYILGSISTAFSKHGKYPKSPMFQIEGNVEKSAYKESQEQVAVYEMKQRIQLLREKGLPESPM